MIATRIRKGKSRHDQQKKEETTMRSRGPVWLRRYSSRTQLDIQGLAVPIPSRYAEAQLPPSPYPSKRRTLRQRYDVPPTGLPKQNSTTLPALPMVARPDDQAEERRRRFINVCRLQEAFRWDADNRHALVCPDSEDFLPLGSLLRIFYYSLPLPEGVVLPLRQPLDASAIGRLKWAVTAASSGVEPRNGYHGQRHRNAGTVTNPVPAGMAIHIPSGLRAAPSLKTGSPEAVPASPDKSTPYWTVNVAQQPQAFYGALVAADGLGSGATLTLRNVVDGIGTEMVFPVFSPLVVALQVVHRATRQPQPDESTLRPGPGQSHLRFLRAAPTAASVFPPLDASTTTTTSLAVAVRPDGSLEANVPYVYLSPPVRQAEDVKKKKK